MSATKANRKGVKTLHRHQAFASLRSRGGLVLLLLALSISMWMIYRLVNMYMLPINTLYVTGNIKHITQAEITEAVQDKIQHGFFAVDLSELRQVLENLRWVQGVSLRRVWPDALHIDIREHIAVARWGQTHLLNQRGELFVPSVWETAGDLPLLVGPDGMHQYLYDQYLELQNILKDADLHVEKLVYDARRAMRVSMANGITMNLGRLNNITDNYSELLLFTKAYQNRLQEKKGLIASIDLRYTNGFAVKWKKTAAMVGSENNKHLDLRT